MSEACCKENECKPIYPQEIALALAPVPVGPEMKCWQSVIVGEGIGLSLVKTVPEGTHFARIVAADLPELVRYLHVVFPHEMQELIPKG